MRRTTTSPRARTRFIHHQPQGLDGRLQRLWLIHLGIDIQVGLTAHHIIGKAGVRAGTKAGMQGVVHHPVQISHIAGSPPGRRHAGPEHTALPVRILDEARLTAAAYDAARLVSRLIAVHPQHIAQNLFTCYRSHCIILSGPAHLRAGADSPAGLRFTAVMAGMAAPCGVWASDATRRRSGRTSIGALAVNVSLSHRHGRIHRRKTGGCAGTDRPQTIL